MMWPPTLSELKLDMGIKDADERDDDRLQQVLAAAIAVVERLHEGSFNFEEDSDSELPDATSDIILGTLRLAGRWHTRRRSPDALIEMSEMGSSRIPSFDPDIDRLLRIGKYRGSVVA